MNAAQADRLAAFIRKTCSITIGSDLGEGAKHVMKRRNQMLSTVLALSVLLAVAARPAAAQTGLGSIGPTKGQVAGVAIGIAAVGAAIGIGVYYATHHNRSVTGCAVSWPSGTTLTTESDKTVYTLTGDVAGIKTGDRVRVSGKKVKQKSAGTRQFIVEKISADYGVCKIPADSSNGN
jgi:NADH:ubiquinone oxidoreductase subunit K